MPLLPEFLRRREKDALKKEKKPRVKRNKRIYFGGTEEQMAEKVLELFEDLKPGDTLNLRACRSGPIGGPYNHISLQQIVPIEKNKTI